MGNNLCSFGHPSASCTDHDHQLDQPIDESFSHVSGNNNSSDNHQSCPMILDLIRRPATCLQKKTDRRAKKRSTSSSGTRASLMHQTAGHDDHHIKKRSKVRKLTLEDWILNSPAAGHVKTDFLHSGGELYVLRHSSRKIHPSASSSSCSRPLDDRSLASKARDSLSLEPMTKSGTSTAHGDKAPDQEDGDSINYSMSRSKSGKSGKKVSFKEDPDIVIIYSPEEAFNEHHQDSVSIYA